MPVQAPAASVVRPPMGIRAPTYAEFVATFRSLVNQREKAHKVKPLKHAPAGFSKAERFDITLKGARGGKREVYKIDNQLYLKLTPVVPHPKAHWYSAGPAPMF
jgi:hypothetical protein